MTDAALLAGLAAIVGTDAVRSDDAALDRAASNVHVTGARPLAHIKALLDPTGLMNPGVRGFGANSRKGTKA